MHPQRRLLAAACHSGEVSSEKAVHLTSNIASTSNITCVGGAPAASPPSGCLPLWGGKKCCRHVPANDTLHSCTYCCDQGDQRRKGLWSDSVSVHGLQIFIWSKDYQENWSAFAPDFKVRTLQGQRQPRAGGIVIFVSALAVELERLCVRLQGEQTVANCKLRPQRMRTLHLTLCLWRGTEIAVCDSTFLQELMTTTPCAFWLATTACSLSKALMC